MLSSSKDESVRSGGGPDMLQTPFLGEINFQNELEKVMDVDPIFKHPDIIARVE
jgi:hypothetical protein